MYTQETSTCSWWIESRKLSGGKLRWLKAASQAALAANYARKSWYLWIFPKGVNWTQHGTGCICLQRGASIKKSSIFVYTGQSRLLCIFVSVGALVASAFLSSGSVFPGHRCQPALWLRTHSYPLFLGQSVFTTKPATPINYPSIFSNLSLILELRA